MLHVQKFFLLIRLTEFFGCFRCLRRVGVTRFYVFFSKLKILANALLLALAKSIY